MEFVLYYLLSAIAALVALTVHEYCHGYAAYKLGDDTAKSFGRLTLNPLKHLDLYGVICLILFRIGWAKPVPINARNFKNPKWGFVITAAAGPLSNLILSFFSALIALLFGVLRAKGDFDSDFVYFLVYNTELFFTLFHLINLGLAIFNLLPIPPFDGSRLISAFLPAEIYFKIMKHERKIYYGVLAALLFGTHIANALRSIPFIGNNPVLNFIAGSFALSEIIGTVIDWVSNLMVSFWQLFPFLQV